LKLKLEEPNEPVPEIFGKVKSSYEGMPVDDVDPMSLRSRR